MRVDIWSDIVCPWCYIGKRRFDQALAGFGGRDEVEVVHHSFELDPSFDRDRPVLLLEMLAAKYRLDPEQAGQADPVRDPRRHDRGDHDRRAHKQDEARVTCLHGCLRMAVPGPELVVTSLPDQRSPTPRSARGGAKWAVQRYNERCFSQSSTSWATSRQPWSIVSE